ncbi:Cof-type HAD-IIB family hydrolase [Lacticaseibacillus hulanensis]|uniref:Cof-type HAD-IIB family hydrolase n=1 Tax=Lacticaseibacillus hulanensis TaxID=2493111 RepID=UPI000FD8074E|nr:Cof-type HAD-IIB family hydrolase [Lacticaseibacillus hulanensis]
MIKLIATEMDGSFLRDDMTYDEAKFAELMKRMQAQNIQFVCASGNQYFQLQSFFTKYPDVIYVAENGAYIRSRDHVYAVSSFKDAATADILTVLNQIDDIKLLVCGQANAYALTTTDPTHVQTMRNYYHELRVIDDFADIDDRILKFAISCPPARTDAIVEHLRSALSGLADVTSSGHGDIDIIQPGLNKAAGLKELGQILGVDLAEMVAFGDGGNDLEMLREVGDGVAMANAQPDVLAVANTTTGSNEDQGVLQYLDKIL